MAVIDVGSRRMSPVAADYALEKSRFPGYGSVSIMPTLTPIPDPVTTAFDDARQREQQRLLAFQRQQIGASQQLLGAGQQTLGVQTGMSSIAGAENIAAKAAAVEAGVNAEPKFEMSRPESDFLQKSLSGFADDRRTPTFNVDSLVNQYTSDEGIRAMVGDLQKQAYGDPVSVYEGMPVYDDSMAKYWGISADEQAIGYLAVKGMPNKVPGPNATYQEKMEYQEKVRRAYQAPKYRVGSEMQILGNMDKASLTQLQRKLAAGRLLPEDYAVVPGVFRSAEFEAFTGLLGTSNREGMTWQERLDMRIAEVKALKEREKRRGAGGGGGGGATTRQVNIQYTQTSIAQGRSLLIAVLRDALGRPPSESELAEFMSRLNAAENKSPVRTVTNYVREGGTMRSTSRTTPSGVDPDEMARQFAAEIGGGDEMAGYKGTRFMDRLVNRLMGAQ